MEKGISYFLGFSAVVYICVVGVYITQYSNAVRNKIPTAITSNDELLESGAYSDPQKRFSIRIPKEWKLNSDGATHVKSIVAFESGRGSDEFRQISISPLSRTRSLEQLLASPLVDFSSVLRGVTVTEDTVVTAHGETMRLLVGTYSSRGVMYREYILFTSHNDASYVVFGSARDTLWGKYKDEIRSSIISLELK